MNTEALIAPSILSADFTDLAGQIHTAENAGADWLHIDVMDGHFVPNLTMGPLIVYACKRITTLPLDVHLMISNPDKYLQDFASAGADRITVHIETCPHIHRTLQAIRAMDVHPGITLNPGTAICTIEETLPFVDLILVMSVNPGFGGQHFIPQSLQKLRRLKAMRDEIGSTALIQVDGGINTDTAAAVRAAGADVFVAGSAIFNHPEGIQTGIQLLRDQL